MNKDETEYYTSVWDSMNSLDRTSFTHFAPYGASTPYSGVGRQHVQLSDLSSPHQFLPSPESTENTVRLPSNYLFSDDSALEEDNV